MLIDPLPYALADYNAGRAHVLRWAKEAARTNSALFLQNMDYPGTRATSIRSPSGATITGRQQNHSSP